MSAHNCLWYGKPVTPPLAALTTLDSGGNVRSGWGAERLIAHGERVKCNKKKKCTNVLSCIAAVELRRSRLIGAIGLRRSRLLKSVVRTVNTAGESGEENTLASVVSGRE